MPRSRLLEQIRRRLDNPWRNRALRGSVQRAFIEATQERFDAQSSADGAPWRALTPEYARRKRGPQILVETGNLLRSLTSPRHAQHVIEYRRRELTLGTSVDYAAANHLTRPFTPETEAIAEAFAEALVESRR